MQDRRQLCTRCSFVVCAACLDQGCGFAGSGVFADMLSLELARELLANVGWLKFRARSYFFKADHNATGCVDKHKAKRVVDRLAAELGIRSFTDAELMNHLRALGHENCSSKEGEAETKEKGKNGSVLDKDEFEEFFRLALTRAVEVSECKDTRNAVLATATSAPPAVPGGSQMCETLPPLGTANHAGTRPCLVTI